ncbi:MAG: fumarate hydratase, partial [Clostridia bacterium]
MEKFKESMLALITETSTYLPPDVRRTINEAKKKEDEGTRSALSLATIAQNITMAEENVSPICQDTGMPTFEIK